MVQGRMMGEQLKFREWERSLSRMLRVLSPHLHISPQCEQLDRAVLFRTHKTLGLFFFFFKQVRNFILCPRNGEGQAYALKIPPPWYWGIRKVVKGGVDSKWVVQGYRFLRKGGEHAAFQGSMRSSQTCLERAYSWAPFWLLDWRVVMWGEETWDPVTSLKIWPEGVEELEGGSTVKKDLKIWDSIVGPGLRHLGEGLQILAALSALGFPVPGDIIWT